MNEEPVRTTPRYRIVDILAMNRRMNEAIEQALFGKPAPVTKRSVRRDKAKFFIKGTTWL